MTDINNYKIEHLQTQMTELIKKADKLEKEFVEYRETESKRENNRLVAGISFLGAVLLSLVGYIWLRMVG